MRNANDDTSNPTNWNRYINPGYYAIMEGSMFDLIWTTQKANPMTLYQIIWYNYHFHVDRNMDIPAKLNNWATQIAHPYLSLHDPKSFDMDTIRNQWKDLRFIDPMEIDRSTCEEYDSDHIQQNNNQGTPNPLPQPYPSEFILGKPNDFSFQINKWIDHPPSPSGLDWFSPEERYRREANAHAYRQYGTTAIWHRYLQLGFNLFNDCKECDHVWEDQEIDPITIHRSIWYGFMVHVDNDIEIPPKLNAWAMQITHAYLSHYDPESLTIDTCNRTWKQMKSQPVLCTTTDADVKWIPVTTRRRTKSPPTPD
jgi:hypothetical protein